MSELTMDKEFVKKYGDYVTTGDKVLETKKSYKTISISPAIDLALGGGIKEGSWMILSGPPKAGKEQPLDSIVYTPDGPVLMGDIEIGQAVCTPDGSVGTVIGVYPQGEKDVYRITFNDGSTAECGLEHLWKLRKNSSDITHNDIIQLKDFKDDLKYNDRNKWKIELTKPVYFEYRQTPLDPYLLGLLIGDGSFCGGRGIKFTNADEEILRLMREKLSEMNLKLKHINRYDYRINRSTFIGRNALVSIIKSLGLKDKNSHEKFIPYIYRYNSIDVRKEIIRGLFDTDGYNANGKYIEYTTVSSRLSDNVIEICRSLGYKVSYQYRTTKCNGKEFFSYRIRISGDNIGDLFKIQRKSFGIRTKNKLFRTIESVEYIGKKKCQCIEIDHPDHLYVTDSFAPTHNTTTTMQIIANCQALGRKIIYLDVEGRLKEMNFEVPGIDPSKVQVIRSGDVPLAAETFLDIARKLVSQKENEGCVLVIDSISSLIPSRDLDEDISGMTRPGLPKILSDFVKKLGQTVPNQKCLVIMITHMITNTSGYGKSKMADGGVKIQFQADTRMEVKSVSPWEAAGSTKEAKNVIGLKVTWDILCSSIGKPYTTCESWIRFGHGIDKIQEILMLSTEIGLISVAGSWYNLDFLEDLGKERLKIQGAEKTYNYLKENPEIYTALENKVREMLY